MNFKLVSVAAALAVSAAIAQDYEDEEETTEAVAEESAPAAAPAAPAVEEEDSSWDKKAEAPAEAQAAAPAAAPAAAQGFKVLHGNAYNQSGNEAGASTIGGDFAMPHKMVGRNLVYVEPSTERANLSVAKGGMTYLLGFDNSLGLAQVTAGIATGNFGVTVDLALDKQWNSTETSTPAGSTENSESVTETGDLIAANVSMNLGAFDLGVRAYWLTFDTERDTESDNAEHDEDFWDIGVNVVLSNAPSAKNLSWSAGAYILRHANTTENSMGNASTETTDPESNFKITPFFNFGMPLMTVANAQLFIGTNSGIPLTFYDEIKDDNSKNNRSEFALYTQPNILAEITLNENWMFFGGANYTWYVFGHKSDETKNNGSTTDKPSTYMYTHGTNANAGARFSYNNFVLEASVAQNLGSSSWSGLVGQLGAFIHF